ncbi:MAG: hypothetical protein ACREV0_12915 [Burkholderiales bacterium]
MLAGTTTRVNYPHHRGKKALFLLALLLTAPFAAAQEIKANPITYRLQLKGLKPGQTLVLEPGNYTDGLPITQLNGEGGRPIVITGPPEGRRAIFLGRADNNTINIEQSSHVVIRNLVLDGQGNSVDAIKAKREGKYAHHITLENLVIRGHDAGQSNVGISTKCPAWGWVVRGNVVEGAGTGMYFGDSDGSAPFIGGLIEHNLVINSKGYNLQVKHQNLRSQLPGMPERTSATIIRHNVFSKAEGSSSEPNMARPNVLVGHFPPSGAGSEDVYLIYGNVFYQNPSERLLQGEGNVALYNNLFINRFGDAISFQRHNALPRKVSIFHNTVLSADTGIAIHDMDSAHSQRIFANVVFATKPLLGGRQEDNVIGKLNDAEEYLIAPNGALGEIDLSPRPQKMKMKKNIFEFQDAKLDFNSQPRKRAFPGAYAHEGKNPGWVPHLERKP